MHLLPRLTTWVQSPCGGRGILTPIGWPLSSMHIPWHAHAFPIVKIKAFPTALSGPLLDCLLYWRGHPVAVDANFNLSSEVTGYATQTHAPALGLKVPLRAYFFSPVPFYLSMCGSKAWILLTFSSPPLFFTSWSREHILTGKRLSHISERHCVNIEFCLFLLLSCFYALKCFLLWHLRETSFHSTFSREA